ncbi:MAG: HVO_0476 family zinc finger protein [Thermoplasmata archaeon]
MRVPSALILECPNCGDNPHRIVKGRVSEKKEIVLEALVRCLKCGQTRNEIVRESMPRSIPIIVSRGESSEKRAIELDPKMIVRRGDRFFFEGKQISITGIEEKGRRPEEAVCAQIDTLWAKRTDRVIVRFSITRAGRTIPKEIEASPDEEFYTGDIVEVGRIKVAIHRIKVKNGLIRNGKARAEDIVRIYATPIRRRLA